MLFGTVSKEPSLDETTNSKKDDFSFIERLKVAQDNSREDQTRNDKILLNSNLSSIQNEYNENRKIIQINEDMTSNCPSIITDYDR